MTAAGVRAWPERLRARHVAPVGVVDTRSVLARYTRWFEWERRRGGVAGRLLARRSAGGEAAAQASDGTVWRTIVSAAVQQEPPSADTIKPIPSAVVSNVIESPAVAAVADEPEKTYRIRRAPPQESGGLQRTVKDASASPVVPQRVLHAAPEITRPGLEEETRVVRRIGRPKAGAAVPSGEDAINAASSAERVMSASPERSQRAGQSPHVHAVRGETAGDGPAPALIKRPRQDERRPDAGPMTTKQAAAGELPRLAQPARVAAVSGPTDVIWREPRADAAPDRAEPGESGASDQAGNRAARLRVASAAAPNALTGETAAHASKQNAATPLHPAARLKDVNYRQLVDQVSRRVLRKISMDLERRGGR